MNRESREERRAKARRRASTFAIGTGLLLVVVIGVLLSMRGEGLDGQGCPRIGGPSREVVVLLDTSDPLSDKHKAELGRILREMTSPAASGRHDGTLAMREGERVTLYLLRSNGAPGALIAQICHPGNPADEPWFTALIEGRLIADRDWRDFKKGLIDEVEKLFPAEEGEGQSDSPILETIAVITANHASSARSATDAKAHLIIISDLLQNTGMLSHYKPYPNPEESPRELRTDLSRVEVSLFRLERHKYEKYQTPEHYYWWIDWVEAMGGKVVWQQAL